MKQLQYAAGGIAIIAASWLLMSPVSDTTTYIRPIIYTPMLSSEPRASIIFGGDMMFDRSIRVAMEQHGTDYIFSCIDDVLQSADLVVANLEGPITTHPSKSVGSQVGGEGNFTFTFPTSTAPLLFDHNIRMVNIGNNHIMNFGLEGLEQTRHSLDDAGVFYFGEPNLNRPKRVKQILLRRIPFSFVNWSDWSSDKMDHTAAQIQQEKASGRVVVVYTHWGDEYMPPPERVKVLARQFIEAGADIVIGSHPHIIQEREIQQGKYIYYSLGNFIFDQYWNESVRRGLLLRVEFTPAGVSSVEEIPIDNQTDRQTCAV